MIRQTRAWWQALPWSTKRLIEATALAALIVLV